MSVDEEVDSLDAYMASLELPPGGDSTSMAQERTERDAYFSDAMMQQRSPALFHFYLGQYRGLDKTTAAPVDSEMQSLSSFLIDTCQRNQMEARRVTEQETWGKFNAADEKHEQSRLQRLYAEDGAVGEEVEEEEDEEEEDADEFSVSERRQQLIEVMSTRFLQGEDGEYVNYTEIDSDETLDDLDEIQRDAEDRYFAVP
ncbi:hypothetical protein BBO99_00002968 [Phytophthora kernoviae]|uniref:CCD97-like C-terminal domain-containing protein n=2 Tax=Phytophthora kernoviae TaxID=325452 RepID=A0A3R7J4Q2_9STRA|nr:hypothetical protein G195_003308 [Phytophthora kernoviae 00238/432]KAG2526537.1 hypothetical protein JM16_002704 [Phytophthora kernoviae]KAG2528113.1 hypothetical protein JM18_003364 [Phytophthora kernoviae]RLN02531.1 hypothetical protein BBI17_003114 [Phytophthora kernoviae]RLN82337.1 hypothetical protein BBO99_00002968 [Phytophthora kernoviae]